MSDLTPIDRHAKIALSFSGGKDSLACVYLLREHLDHITLYHVDTGDLLPEMQESVARVEAFAPHFVRIETHVVDWINEHGLPSDLVPYSSHPIGQAMGEGHHTLVSRYDCCWHNLMLPLYARVIEDGNTLLIRGTKRVDMKILPVVDGTCDEKLEYYYPLQDWSNDQVFAFLALHNVELPRLYASMTNAPECARCTAWWNEGRRAYLSKHYPALWRDYDARLQVVIDEIALPLRMLKREAGS